jgi:hypothetical protein
MNCPFMNGTDATPRETQTKLDFQINIAEKSLDELSHYVSNGCLANGKTIK